MPKFTRSRLPEIQRPRIWRAGERLRTKPRDILAELGFTELDVLRSHLQNREAEHREALQPDSLPETLDLLWKTASHAESQNDDPIVSVGLELIARVAMDLRLMFDRYAPSDPALVAEDRADIETRHTAALNSVVPASLLLHLDGALEAAARLPTDGEWDAVQSFVDQVGARLPSFVTDEQIARALAVYRLERNDAGRPSDDAANRASANRRAEQLRLLTGSESEPESIARTLRRHSKARWARVARLTGHNYDPEAKPGSA